MHVDIVVDRGAVKCAPLCIARKRLREASCKRGWANPADAGRDCRDLPRSILGYFWPVRAWDSLYFRSWPKDSKVDRPTHGNDLEIVRGAVKFGAISGVCPEDGAAESNCRANVECFAQRSPRKISVAKVNPDMERRDCTMFDIAPAHYNAWKIEDQNTAMTPDPSPMCVCVCHRLALRAPQVSPLSGTSYRVARGVRHTNYLPIVSSCISDCSMLWACPDTACALPPLRALGTGRMQYLPWDVCGGLRRVLVGVHEMCRLMVVEYGRKPCPHHYLVHCASVRRRWGKLHPEALLSRTLPWQIEQRSQHTPRVHCAMPAQRHLTTHRCRGRLQEACVFAWRKA